MGKISDQLAAIANDKSLTGREKFDRSKALVGNRKGEKRPRDKRGRAFRKSEGKSTVADRLREAAETTPSRSARGD